MSYCGRDAVTAGLEGLAGVTGTAFSEDIDGVPRLTVEFDADVIRDDAVVAAVRTILEGLDDPVYELPLEVEFRGE